MKYLRHYCGLVCQSIRPHHAFWVLGVYCNPRFWLIHPFRFWIIFEKWNANIITIREFKSNDFIGFLQFTPLYTIKRTTSITWRHSFQFIFDGWSFITQSHIKVFTSSQGINLNTCSTNRRGETMFYCLFLCIIQSVHIDFQNLKRSLLMKLIFVCSV